MPHGTGPSEAGCVAGPRARWVTLHVVCSTCSSCRSATLELSSCSAVGPAVMPCGSCSSFCVTPKQAKLAGRTVKLPCGPLTGVSGRCSYSQAHELGEPAHPVMAEHVLPACMAAAKQRQPACSTQCLHQLAEPWQGQLQQGCRMCLRHCEASDISSITTGRLVQQELTALGSCKSRQSLQTHRMHLVSVEALSRLRAATYHLGTGCVPSTQAWPSGELC
jgi:hypothetical protein